MTDTDPLKELMRQIDRARPALEAWDQARAEIEAEKAAQAGDQPLIDAIRQALDDKRTISREQWIEAAAVAHKRHGSGSARSVAEMIGTSESTVMRRWREVRKPREEWPNPS